MSIRDLVRRGRAAAPAHREGWLEPFRSLQNEMNRVFEDFIGPWRGQMEAMRGFGPRVDMREDKETIEVIAELPGLTEKEVQVELSPARDVLTIRGEKHDEREERKGDYYFAERSFGSFRRQLELPSAVRDEDIQANFKNGVLTIKLQKSGEHESGRTRIEIKPT